MTPQRSIILLPPVALNLQNRLSSSTTYKPDKFLQMKSAKQNSEEKASITQAPTTVNNLPPAFHKIQ